MKASNNHWSHWLVLAALLLIGVSIAWAQGGAATLEGVSAVVPEGWLSAVSEDSGTIFIASDADALETLSSGGGVLTGDQYGVSIAVPSSLTGIGIDSSAAPTDALEAFLALLGEEAPIIKEDGFSIPAASVLTVSDMIPGGELLVYAFAFDGASILVALQKGSDAPDYLTDEVLQILNSLVYGAPAEGDETAILGEAQPLTFVDVTVPIPEGWVTFDQEQSALIVGINQEAVDAFVDGESIPAGGRLFLVIPPSVYESVGMNAKDPAGQLVEMVEGMDLNPEGEALPLDGAAQATWALLATMDDSTDQAQVMVIDDPNGRMVVFAVYSGDPEPYREEALAFINGISVVGGSAPVEVGGETIRQWAASASGSSQYGSSSWTFEQATGEPDTASCGDIGTAWASASSTGKDTLVLVYAESVIPSQVNIYQTYNPGAIYRVELSSSASGETFVLPDSADPVGNTPCPGIFTLDIGGITAPVDTVTIFLDQTLSGSWNEIDAVELVGAPAN
ncbi:MAG: hypothetical protein L6Q98_21135 [Anaerolineae bacterium]|nr:hypothetical protein [Anaerolineae bacterium]NUQ06474.1 hypothetical protein [Anaerolineae bacterium]